MLTLGQQLRSNYDEAQAAIASEGGPSSEHEDLRGGRPLPSDGGSIAKSLGWTEVQSRNGGRAYITKGGTEIPAWALWVGGGLLFLMLFRKRGR